MKRLNSDQRAKVLHCLMEGCSIRATARLTGVSKTTILKLVEDAGQAAAWYQERVLQNLNCQRVQADEAWGFVGAKAFNAKPELKATGEQGDCWLWIAMCADTKLVFAWYVGNRRKQAAIDFMDDVASRVTGRIQLSTDAHGPYAVAVEKAFGADVDYGRVVKIFGTVPEASKGRYSPAICIGARKERVEGNPDPKHVSTSFAERNNLNVRMHSRRMTRLTNAFSKKVANHAHAMARHFLYYNFVRVHQTLKVTPAMAAGITKRLWEMADVVEMVESWEKTQLRQA